MRHAILAFVVLCAFAPIAEGNAILFNDRAAFNAAVTRYHLFSDFDITSFNPGALVATGNYGGIQASGDVTRVIFGNTLGATSTPGTSQLFVSLTAPVTAVGFDVVQSGYTGNFSQFFPNALNFSFGTAGGLGITSNLAVHSFFGVLLVNDMFSSMSLGAADPGCACSTAFAIDNLAVQTVPEPSTLGLVVVGCASVLGLWRRSRRR